MRVVANFQNYKDALTFLIKSDLTYAGSKRGDPTNWAVWDDSELASTCGYVAAFRRSVWSVSDIVPVFSTGYILLREYYEERNSMGRL